MKYFILHFLLQIILTVAQMMWCRDITEILEGDLDRKKGMEDFEQKSFRDLNQLAAIVRGELPKLARAVLCALITIDVHARDMVTEMVRIGVSITVISHLNSIAYICNAISTRRTCSFSHDQ